MSFKNRLAASLIIVAVLLLGLCTPCSGEMVYDNGVTANTAYFSDAGTSGQQIYDDFTLSPSGSTDINIASWTGLYATNNAPTDNFTVEIWDGGGNTPASLVTSINVTSVSRNQVGSIFGRDLYQYTAEFDPVSLNASQNYWFSVVNDTNEGWAWMANRNIGQLSFRTSQAGQFLTAQSEMDFSLYSTPEPNALTMIILGLLPTAIRRRRSRTSRCTNVNESCDSIS